MAPEKPSQLSDDEKRKLMQMHQDVAARNATAKIQEWGQQFPIRQVGTARDVIPAVDPTYAQQLARQNRLKIVKASIIEKGSEWLEDIKKQGIEPSRETLDAFSKLETLSDEGELSVNLEVLRSYIRKDCAKYQSKNTP